MKKRHGFTLIELMIVIAVIAVIVSIAIPRLMRSRLASNEASALNSLRTISTAQASFKTGAVVDSDNDNSGEFGSFQQLTNEVPAFIDSVLGSGRKSGYFFVVTTTGVVDTDEMNWCATAYPMSKGLTGNRSFYVDESGVLRGSDMGGAVGAPGIPATRWMAAPAAGGNFPPIH